MIFAKDQDGNRITALKGRQATCPLCFSPVIQKCGEIVRRLEMKNRTIEYERYLLSTDWKITRAIAKARAGNRCEKCGASGPLQVHHVSYDRLGHEWQDDLSVLCGKCHVEAHKEITKSRETVSEKKRYYAGLDTYMTKKHGEDWDLYVDPDLAEEEFDQWIESKPW